jgi:hypothetical protein
MALFVHFSNALHKSVQLCVNLRNTFKVTCVSSISSPVLLVKPKYTK